MVPGTTCVFFSMVVPDTNCSQKKLGKFSDLKKRGFSTVLNTQRIFFMRFGVICQESNGTFKISQFVLENDYN